MKKLFAAVLMTCALAANANAFYISGSAGTVSGDDDYKATSVNLLLGMENLAIEPSWKSYKNKNTEAYNTYGLRTAWETDLFTAGVYGGLTPKKAYIKGDEDTKYSNQFVGADFTISLNPIGSTHSRLVGPGNRGISVGGEGITRVDVGAGIKYTNHKTENKSNTPSEVKMGQTEYQLFAGAQVLMLNVAAGMSYFDYNEEVVNDAYGYITGVNYAVLGKPESAFNLRVDVPFFPIVTPYVGYSKVKYDNDGGHSNNYEFGAYLDFAMLTANVSYQIAERDSHHDSFLSAGIGLKFE